MKKGVYMDIKNKGRVFLLDEIRGFAILCMVVYHAMFNLKYEFEVMCRYSLTIGSM